MTEVTTERKVFAYIAHKDGAWIGIIAGTLDYALSHEPTKAQSLDWKKEVAKFCGDAIADGFDIARVYSREEHEALLNSMRMWKRPAPGPAPQGDLFNDKADPA